MQTPFLDVALQRQLPEILQQMKWTDRSHALPLEKQVTRKAPRWAASAAWNEQGYLTSDRDVLVTPCIVALPEQFRDDPQDGTEPGRPRKKNFRFARHGATVSIDLDKIFEACSTPAQFSGASFSQHDLFPRTEFWSVQCSSSTFVLSIGCLSCSRPP